MRPSLELFGRLITTGHVHFYVNSRVEALLQPRIPREWSHTILFTDASVLIHDKGLGVCTMTSLAGHITPLLISDTEGYIVRLERGNHENEEAAVGGDIL